MPDAPLPSHDLDQLKRALMALKKARARIDALERASAEPIAIVGIGCRLPGDVNTPAAFWDLLRAGRSGIVEVPPERWDVRAYFDPRPDIPGKMQAIYGGFIKNADLFDPHFFGISPREANAMDPQQRMALEVAWEALEDAGIIPASLAGGSAGVFIGVGFNDYGRLQTVGQEVNPTVIDHYFLQGNSLSIMANRI
jgi:acyl transferase domain-containing protein